MAFFAQQTSALVKPPEKTVIQGGFSGDIAYQDTLTIGMLAPLFLEWTRYEMRRAPATVQRYGEALQWVIRDIGDQPVTGLHLGHLLTLRRKMEARGCREARIAAILHGLRAFLKFCREVVRVPTLSAREIRVPRIPRRDVVYLTHEEVQHPSGWWMRSLRRMPRGRRRRLPGSAFGHWWRCSWVREPGSQRSYRSTAMISIGSAKRPRLWGKATRNGCSILPTGRSCGWSGTSPGGGMMTTRFL
jgi:hypothetical protein